MLKAYRAELHVHTVLSPCADVAMTPPLIVEQACDEHIDLIAITDHNATANIAAVQKAAVGFPLTVLPGMELQTAEDVHILCIFPTITEALSFQQIVDDALPPLSNNPDFFGEQFIVDETGDYLGTDQRLLSTSTSINLFQACQLTHSINGMFIPAHINRKAFGLLPILGFLPVDIPFDALEISRYQPSATVLKQYPEIASFPLLQGGDVHYLDGFLGINHFFAEEPNFSEFQAALQRKEGRYHQIFTKFDNLLFN